MTFKLSFVLKLLVGSLVIFLGLAFFTPLLTLAQEPTTQTSLSELAQCTGPDCSTCNIVYMANGLIKWLIGIVFLLFAGLLAIAGVRLVTSGGNPGALQSAKDNFMNALIGFVIILSAWLIIDTLMRALVGNSEVDGSDGFVRSEGEASGWLFWSQVECVGRIAVSTSTPELINLDRNLDGTFLDDSAGGGYSSTPPPAGNLVTYAGAQFDASIVDRVRYIAENFNLRVSGGYRTPARNAEVNGARNSYHLTGRAADFTGASADRQRALQWARQNGAIEAMVHDAGSGTHLHVAW